MFSNSTRKDPRPHSLRTRVLLVTSAMVVLPAWEIHAQQEVVDMPVCESCRVVPELVLTLGDVDGVGSLSGAPAGVARDGQGRYWIAQGSQPTLIFDSNGRIIRELGRRGSGPAEYMTVSIVVPLPGDSVLIFDSGNRRAVVVGADFRPVRFIAVPAAVSAAAVLRWPDRVVVSANLREPPSSRGLASHIVNMSGANLAVVRSFGVDPALPPGADVTANDIRQRYATTAEGTLWSADRAQYRLAQWTSEGEFTSSLRRVAPWFYRLGQTPPRGTDVNLPSSVHAISHDSMGRIWTYVYAARTAGQILQEARPSAGAGDIAIQGLPPTHRLYHTVVEVIDPESRRVSVRTILEETVVAALPGSRVAIYEEDAIGIPRVRIEQLTLVEN
jgi:hypothetical protein